MKNKNCIRYYKTVQGLFPHVGFSEARFLKGIKLELDEFENESPECTYTQIEAFFGSAQDTVRDYINDTDAHDLCTRKKMTRTLKALIVVLILSILICWIASFLQLEYERSSFEDDLPGFTIEQINEGIQPK